VLGGRSPTEPRQYRAEFLATPAGSDDLPALHATLVNTVDAHMIVDTGASNSAWVGTGSHIASVVIIFKAAGDAEAQSIVRQAARSAIGWSIETPTVKPA